MAKRIKTVVVKRISNTSSGSGTAVLSVDAQHVWATTVFQLFKMLLTITQKESKPTAIYFVAPLSGWQAND